MQAVYVPHRSLPIVSGLQNLKKMTQKIHVQCGHVSVSVQESSRGIEGFSLHQNLRWSRWGAVNTLHPCCFHPVQCRSRWSLGWRRTRRQPESRTDSTGPVTKGEQGECLSEHSPDLCTITVCSSIFTGAWETWYNMNNYASAEIHLWELWAFTQNKNKESSSSTITNNITVLIKISLGLLKG